MGRSHGANLTCRPWPVSHRNDADEKKLLARTDMPVNYIVELKIGKVTKQIAEKAATSSKVFSVDSDAHCFDPWTP